MSEILAAIIALVLGAVRAVRGLFQRNRRAATQQGLADARKRAERIAEETHADLARAYAEGDRRVAEAYEAELDRAADSDESLGDLLRDELRPDD
jgi:hypothetical protein